MGRAVDNILKQFDEVFEEETWQVPVRAAISGLTASQAAWKPSRGRHSIWEIANHLSLWKEYFLARMAGETRRPTGWAHEADWREIPEVTEDAWRASVRRLLDAHAALKSEFSKRTDEDLQRPLPGDKLPLHPPEDSGTRCVPLWTDLLHSSASGYSCERFVGPVAY